MAKEMKTAVCHQFGKPLAIEEVPIPALKPHQILVKIQAWDLTRRTLASTNHALLKVAASGKFSSDRTIAEYTTGIWNVEPCPVP